MPRASRSASGPRYPQNRFRGRRLLAPLAIVAVALWAYHNSFGNPFIFDDVPHLQRNPTIRHLWPPWEAMAYTSRPLVQLSFALNYAISRLDVWSYHATNLVIHALAGLVLFGLIHRTLENSERTKRYRSAASSLALAAALIWIAHPLQTEAVTYLIQRSESLAGLFYLLTLYFVARGSGSTRPHRWYAAAVGLSALGMASKPVMATAPVMALVYDRMFLSASFRRLWSERGWLHVMLFATIGLIPLCLAAAPQDWRNSSGWNLPGVSPSTYAMTEIGVVLHYLRLSAWPHPLCLDYSWPLTQNLSEVIAPAAAIGLLAGATVLLALRGSPPGFLGLWFFLILAPTSSVIPLLDPAFEHRMYLPLAAVALVATVGGHEALRALGVRLAWSPGRVRVVAASLLTLTVLALATLTVRRNADYQSPVAIWSDTVAKRPTNLRARVSLAFALAHQGGFENGMGQLEEVLRRAPKYPWAHLAAGYFLTKQGRLDEALPHLRYAVHELPTSAEAHYLLGSVLSDRGELDEAVGQLTEAVRLEPWRTEALNNLGGALNRREDWDAAVRYLVEALKLDPGYAKAHFNLGMAFAGKGDLDRARQEIQTALRLQPSFELARQALETLRKGNSR